MSSTYQAIKAPGCHPDDCPHKCCVGEGPTAHCGSEDDCAGANILWKWVFFPAIIVASVAVLVIIILIIAAIIRRVKSK